VTVAWAANPLLLASWLLILLRRWRVALLCSIGATAVAFTVFTLRTYSYSDFVVYHTVPITGYGAGFYLWFTSIFLTALAAGVGLLDAYTRVPSGNRAGMVWGLGAPAVLVAIFLVLDQAAAGWNQPYLQRSNQRATEVASGVLSTRSAAAQGTATHIAVRASYTPTPDRPPDTWQVTFQEDFKSPRTGPGDWPNGDADYPGGHVEWSFRNEKYVWKFTSSEPAWVRALPDESQATEFQVAVTGERKLGDNDCSYGIFMRVDRGFLIRDDQTWSVVEIAQNKVRDLVTGKSKAIRPNQPNKILVQGFKGAYVFFVNDEKVGQADAELDEEWVVNLLIANGRAQTCEIEFDDFELREP
jgi:hypothetical protein